MNLMFDVEQMNALFLDNNNNNNNNNNVVIYNDYI